MNYFEYLRITKKEDNILTFMEYLIDILGYSTAQAEQEKKYYFY